MQSQAKIAQMPGISGEGESPQFAALHWTISEIAQLWKLSDETVRKIFEKEPGVISIGAERSTGRKRRYLTIRVPGDVLERVYRRLQRTS